MSSPAENEGNRLSPLGGGFPTTHWSAVLAARERDGRLAQIALESLCRAYWAPLYAYIRRDGYTTTEAEDLTQEFFARLLARDYLQHLHHRNGRFRSFLLTFLKHFLADERDRAGARKRGGDREFVSLDDTLAEEQFLVGWTATLSPEQLFERRWAQAVMDRALSSLRAEYAAAGKGELFEILKDIQPGEHGAASYAEIGARFGLAEGTIASAVHRLRRRHREILRQEIAQTVGRPEEVDEEIRSLLAILSR